jgi:hypothetical protein
MRKAAASSMLIALALFGSQCGSESGGMPVLSKATWLAEYSGQYRIAFGKNSPGPGWEQIGWTKTGNGVWRKPLPN